MSSDVNTTPPPPQPEAFSFFPSDRWVEFCEAALVHARMAGLDVRYGPGGQLHASDGTVYGLMTVAGRCAELPREEWDGVLEEYWGALGDVLTNSDFGTEVLMVRVFPDAAVPDEALEHPQWRQLATGLRAALVASLPGALRTLTPEDIERLGGDVELLWEAAWDNVVAEEPDRRQVDRVRSAELVSMFGNSFFVASKVGRLDRVIEGIGEWGALVVVPRRHTLVTHVIRDMSVLDAVQVMLPYGHKVTKQGPGAISSDLYWWHDGELTLLPSTETEDRIAFNPPPEFVAMLGRLAGASGSGGPDAPAPGPARG